jgi:hypothetical protein
MAGRYASSDRSTASGGIPELKKKKKKAKSLILMIDREQPSKKYDYREENALLTRDHKYHGIKSRPCACFKYYAYYALFRISHEQVGLVRGCDPFRRFGGRSNRLLRCVCCLSTIVRRRFDPSLIAPSPGPTTSRVGNVCLGGMIPYTVRRPRTWLPQGHVTPEFLRSSETRWSSPFGGLRRQIPRHRSITPGPPTSCDLTRSLVTRHTRPSCVIAMSSQTLDFVGELSARPGKAILADRIIALLI